MTVSIGQLRSAMFTRETEKARRIEEKLESDAVQMFERIENEFEGRLSEIFHSNEIVYEHTVRVNSDDLLVLDRAFKMVAEKYSEFSPRMQTNDASAIFIFDWRV